MALDLGSALEKLKTELIIQKEKMLLFIKRNNALKSKIENYKLLHGSLATLTCWRSYLVNNKWEEGNLKNWRFWVNQMMITKVVADKADDSEE